MTEQLKPCPRYGCRGHAEVVNTDTVRDHVRCTHPDCWYGQHPMPRRLWQDAARHRWDEGGRRDRSSADHAAIAREMRAAAEKYGPSETVLPTAYGTLPSRTCETWAGFLRRLADRVEHLWLKLQHVERENARLAECMRIAGLQAFMRDRDPAEVAEHLRDVAESWGENAKDCAECEAAMQDMRDARDEALRERDANAVAMAHAVVRADKADARAERAEEEMRRCERYERLRLNATLPRLTERK